MTFETFLNLLIVALLTVGIIYAIILEYRLSLVKENHRNLNLLMKQFYDASRKAQSELFKLKNIEEKAAKDLKSDLDRAALVRDEIKYLLNKAEQTKTLASYAPATADSLFSFEPFSRAADELKKKLEDLK